MRRGQLLLNRKTDQLLSASFLFIDSLFSLFLPPFIFFLFIRLLSKPNEKVLLF